MLGYLPKLNRVFLADKSMNVTSYTLHVSIINYQTAVLRGFGFSPWILFFFGLCECFFWLGDLNAAAQILPSIPKEFHERISQFLEAQGHKV